MQNKILYALLILLALVLVGRQSVFTVSEGQTIPFSLSWYPATDAPPRPVDEHLLGHVRARRTGGGVGLQGLGGFSHMQD